MSKNKMIGNAIYGKDWDKVKLINEMVNKVEDIIGVALTESQRSEIFTCMAIVYEEGGKYN